MAFEFFFGLFGLISSDSHQRQESDWRLLAPLNASLFNEASGKKSPPISPTSFMDSVTSADGSHQPVFSTSGTLITSNVSMSEGIFSSETTSSASSVVSTTGSTTTLVTRPTNSNMFAGKKYEFMEKPRDRRAEEDLGRLSSSSSPGANSLGHTQEHLEPTTSDDQATIKPKRNSFRVIYCRTVCIALCFNVIRLMTGLVVERSIITLDFYYLGPFRIHFLIPALCLAIQVAAVSLIFIRNNDETNWLVPFYSSKDYLIRSRSNFRPKIEDYSHRVNISVSLALIFSLMSAITIPAYLINSVVSPPGELAKAAAAAQAAQAAAAASSSGGSNSSPTITASSLLPHIGESPIERIVLMCLLGYDIFWAIYATYICFLVSFYFNLICSIMKARFQAISKIIEDLAESNTSKTTNQARKITTLYLEHNEACELLDESNDFWQYLIFFTYFTYIPAYCYCLYNLFFVDFDAWPSLITWIIHNHTGFIILLISFSAAGVSTEAHAPYTSLHTLSLIQLPLDVEVNIATFLHRVRGLTIGYSCYDLFAITNASMSNTAAACASYFLIVADFSRSSVFTLAHMNGSQVASGTVSGAMSTVGAAVNGEALTTTAVSA